MPVADMPTYPLALQLIALFQEQDPNLTTTETTQFFGVTPSHGNRYTMSLYPQVHAVKLELYGGRPLDPAVAGAFIQDTITAANAVGCEAAKRGNPRLGADPLVRVKIASADFHRPAVQQLIQALAAQHL